MMMTQITPGKRLYNYTSALSAGISLAEVNIKSFLPRLYLENKNNITDLNLIYSGDVPDRYPEAYEGYLNRIGVSFGVIRGKGENDEAYRQKIKLKIVQSPTISGIKRALETVFSGLGFNSKVMVMPANDYFFDGVTSTLDNSFRTNVGSRNFRVEIRLFPGERVSYPNFAGEFFSGEIPYNIKKSGVYNIYFDPKSIYKNVDLGEIKVFSRITSNNGSFSEIYSSNNNLSSTSLPLGFITEFTELKVTVENSAYKNIYPIYLDFNNYRFDFYNVPEYNNVLLSFGVRFLREIFTDVPAASIYIERIAE